MYIKVVAGEYTRSEMGEGGYHPPVELLVNPDCPIRVIYDYIHHSCGVDSDLEFDLCDDNGNLVFIYEKEPWMNGLNYLLPRTTYMLVLLERDEDGRTINPLLHIPDSQRKSVNQWNDIMGKIRKQLNPGVSSKASRTSRTRASSTALAK